MVGKETPHCYVTLICYIAQVCIPTNKLSLCFEMFKPSNKCYHLAPSVFFVTKIKTRTRIIDFRFKETRTKIIVIRKLKLNKN